LVSRQNCANEWVWIETNTPATTRPWRVGAFRLSAFTIRAAVSTTWRYIVTAFPLVEGYVTLTSVPLPLSIGGLEDGWAFRAPWMKCSFTIGR